MLLASVPDDAADAPLLLTATVAVGLAAAIRLRNGNAPVAPDPMAGHAVDFLRMLNGVVPSREDADALETYLLCSMDHGLNASTFTARVTASTEATLSDAVTAALCSLKGPLHGGAPGPVLDMLDGIGPVENAEPWLDAAVMRGDRLMGFGHRMYRVRDPRCDVVKAVVAKLNRNVGRLRYAEAVEAAALAVLEKRKPQRSLQTNHRVLHCVIAGSAWLAAGCVHRRVRGGTRGGVDCARVGTAGRRAVDPASVGIRGTDARQCVIGGGARPLLRGAGEGTLPTPCRRCIPPKCPVRCSRA